VSLWGTIGGLLSAALSVASRRPGVTRHPALRSSDFPPSGEPCGLPAAIPQPVLLDLNDDSDRPVPAIARDGNEIGNPRLAVL